MVQVSSHRGARESHALWQGGIYTLEQFERVCGYGEPSNPNHIYSYNCRHTHYPYRPGISEPIKFEPEPGPFLVNGRKYTYYEATQKQRKMERDIRALKREVNAGGDKAVLGSLIRQKTQEYNAFSKACDIRPKLERLRVLGYDRNTAARVVSAIKKREKQLSVIASGSYKKAITESGMPKVVPLPDEGLKRTTKVGIGQIQSVVPRGSTLTSVRVIAGSGTSTPINDISRLAAMYNDYGDVFGWQKKVGTVHTENFSYELHWYENFGKVPAEEIKTARIKEK